MREVKRVPLDFNYPLGKVWYGYKILSSFRTCFGAENCELCHAMIKEISPYKEKKVDLDSYCPDLEAYFKEAYEQIRKLCDPPEGDGYQLWDGDPLLESLNSSLEAYPLSPVFASLEDLCVWCEEHSLTLTGRMGTRDEWREVLSKSINDERSNA